MKCPKCKNPIEDNTAECEWCGNNIVNNADNEITSLSTFKVRIFFEKKLGLLGGVYASIYIDDIPYGDIYNGKTKEITLQRGKYNFKCMPVYSPRMLIFAR